jgi:hypothetical protein
LPPATKIVTDYPRIDPVLRLAIGKEQQVGAGQYLLSRLENEVLGHNVGLEALKGSAIMPSTIGFNFKNRNLGGFYADKEVPKTISAEAAKVAA